MHNICFLAPLATLGEGGLCIRTSNEAVLLPTPAFKTSTSFCDLLRRTDNTTRFQSFHMWLNCLWSFGIFRYFFYTRRRSWNRGVQVSGLQSSHVTADCLLPFKPRSSPAASLASSWIRFQLSRSQIVRMKMAVIGAQWAFFLLGLAVLASARPKSGQCDHLENSGPGPLEPAGGAGEFLQFPVYQLQRWPKYSHSVWK